MEEFVKAVKLFLSDYAQNENFCRGQLLSISKNEAFFSVKANSQKTGDGTKLIEGRVPLSGAQSYNINREIDWKTGDSKKTHLPRPGRKNKLDAALGNDFLNVRSMDYRISRRNQPVRMTLGQILSREGVSLSEN